MPARRAVVTGRSVLVLIGAHFVLMTTQLMWMQLMMPAVLLLVGHLAADHQALPA